MLTPSPDQRRLIKTCLRSRFPSSYRGCAENTPDQIPHASCVFTFDSRCTRRHHVNTILAASACIRLQSHHAAPSRLSLSYLLVSQVLGFTVLMSLGSSYCSTTLGYHNTNTSQVVLDRAHLVPFKVRRIDYSPSFPHSSSVADGEIACQ